MVYKVMAIDILAIISLDVVRFVAEKDRFGKKEIVAVIVLVLFVYSINLNIFNITNSNLDFDFLLILVIEKRFYLNTIENFVAKNSIKEISFDMAIVF